MSPDTVLRGIAKYVGHYPGATAFLVVTLPGVEVRWLPEQDGRLAASWKPRLRKSESA